MTCRFFFTERLPSHVRTGLLLAVLSLGATTAAANSGKDAIAAHQGQVTADVCGVPTTYSRAPARAVTMSINALEMMLELGLRDRIAGYGGLGRKKYLPVGLQEDLVGLKNISGHGTTGNMESILGAQADFVLAGYGTGFGKDGAQLSPERLAEFGIMSYVISESCRNVGRLMETPVSIKDNFNDYIQLGKIFGVETRAVQLVEAQKARLNAVKSQLTSTSERPGVFVYDMISQGPFTTGRDSLMTELIALGGGINIFADLPVRWMHTNWEDVIDRNPEWIVIVADDPEHTEEKKRILLRDPKLQHITAIRKQNFLMIDFPSMVPNPRNVDVVETLARVLHPGRRAAAPASP